MGQFLNCVYGSLRIVLLTIQELSKAQCNFCVQAMILHPFKKQCGKIKLCVLMFLMERNSFFLLTKRCTVLLWMKRWGFIEKLQAHRHIQMYCQT